MLHLELEPRVLATIKEIKATLANPPDMLSMLSGENFYNNKIDWDKDTQEFSNDWINWRSDHWPLSVDNSTPVLEFALDSAQHLFVQTELSSKGHIDLVLGDNCFCAGTFHFDGEGYLEEIYLDSGHYRPAAEHGKFLIALLLSTYDLSSEEGQNNLKHFLDHVKIHIYNSKTNSFDQCLADDIMTGKYRANLKRERETEHKEMDKRDLFEQLEAFERIAPFTKFIDELIKFNAIEHIRLQAKSPVTGKEDHAAKLAAFSTNLINLKALAANASDLKESDLKAQINLYLTATESACNMRTHKNLDAMVGFFKRKPVLSYSQKNYADFVTENKELIDKLQEISIGFAKITL